MTRHASHIHGAFSWLDLNSPDLAASRAFYAALFGWSYNDIPIGEGSVYAMCLKEGVPVAALATAIPGQPAPPQWQSFVSVSDVDAAAAKAAAAGGNIVHCGDVAEAGRIALVADPEGARFALWQAKAHIGARRLNEHGALAWNELHSADVEVARRFYPAVVGWDTVAMPMGPGEYIMFTQAGNPKRSHGGLVPALPGEASRWEVVFQVGDCAAALAVVAAGGGKIVQSPMDIPGIGRFAKCADNVGAAFGLLQSI